VGYKQATLDQSTSCDDLSGTNIVLYWSQDLSYNGELSRAIYRALWAGLAARSTWLLNTHAVISSLPDFWM
jgi:hypothetical protein